MNRPIRRESTVKETDDKSTRIILRRYNNNNNNNRMNSVCRVVVRQQPSSNCGSSIVPRRTILVLITILLISLLFSCTTFVSSSSSSAVRTKSPPGWFRRTSTNNTTTTAAAATNSNNKKDNNEDENVQQQKQSRSNKSKQLTKEHEVDSLKTNPSTTKKDNQPPWDPITALLNHIVINTSSSQSDDKKPKKQQQKQQKKTDKKLSSKVDGDNKDESTATSNNEGNKKSIFRFFSTSSASDSDKDSKEKQKPNDDQVQKDTKSTTDDTNDDVQKSGDETIQSDTTVPESDSPSANTTTSTIDSNSTTTTATDATVSNETDITVQQQLPGNMIILHGPSDGKQQYRRQFPSQQQQGTILLSPGGMPPTLFLSPQQQQQHQQRQLQQQQQQQQQQMPQNSLIFVDLLASIIGTAMRLWFLTWITRFLASQEQYITPTQHFVYERLNDRYERDTAALRTVLEKGPLYMKLNQWKKYQRKYRTQSVPKHHYCNNNKKKYPTNPAVSMTSVSPVADMVGTTFDTTVLVVELRSDSKGEIDIPYFTDVVNFITLQYKMYAFGMNKTYPYHPLNVEIILLVQSPGGSVATYGLAAAQIQRLQRCSIQLPQVPQQQEENTSSNEESVAGNITETTIVNPPKIKVTVCVDKYAASGGYMMASQADYLIAAPFATVGSVGVIMEGLNFHEIATRYGVTPLVLKAGTSKNPITTWGPVTQNELDSESDRLRKVHIAFQDFVLNGRPVLRQQANDADDAAIRANLLDGSVYIGYEAKELKLVDDIMTSDEYILSKITTGNRVLKIHKSSEYSDRGRSLRNISPLDILPHLLKWGSNSIQSVLSGSNEQHTNPPEQQQSTGSGSKLLRYGILASIGVQPFISNILRPLLQGNIFSSGRRQQQQSYSESMFNLNNGSIHNPNNYETATDLGQQIIQKLVHGVVYATFAYKLLLQFRN